MGDIEEKCSAKSSLLLLPYLQSYIPMFTFLFDTILSGAYIRRYWMYCNETSHLGRGKL